jgi:hypothetical protein
MKFIGRIADIGIAKETTRGTAESAATFYLPKMSFTYDDVIDQIMDESSVGVIEDATDAKVVGKHGVGEFEGNIGDKSIGLLLYATFGTLATTTAGETSTYQHTFSIQEDAQSDSLTIFQEDPNADYKYPLGMVDSFGITAVVGEFAKVTVGFRSKVGTTGTLTPSYTAENRFLPQHGTLKYGVAQSNLASGTAVNIRSIQLSISKNVEDDMKLGSVDPVDILNKQVSVEGTVEMVYDSELFKTQMLADTAQALRIELENTDVTIGTTLHPKLTIDLYKVKWGEFTRNYGNNDIVTVTAKFKGLYYLTDSAMIKAVLVNGQATY